MGTRNLTMVKLGEKVFGQYGQWDGYPSSNGVKVLDFLQDVFDEAVFKAQFEKARLVGEDEVGEVYNRLQALGVERHDNPMCRDMGTGVLPYIQKALKPAEIFNSIAFAADSLFCEWAYMIDLDERKLRIFEGFNKSPLADGQFFKENAKLLSSEETVGGSEYHPIKEIASLTFDEIATISKEDFLATCKKNSRNPDDED